MKKLHRVFSTTGLILWDILSAVLSVYGGFRLKFGVYPSMPAHFARSLLLYMAVIAGMIILGNLLFDCYNTLWKYVGVSEFFRLACSVGTICVVILLLDRIFLLRLPATVVVIMSAFLLLFTAFGRLVAYFFQMIHVKFITWRQKETKRVLIYGAGSVGSHLVQELKSDPDMKRKPVAIIDDDLGMKGVRINGVKVVGPRKELEEAIQDYHVKEVILAINHVSQDFVAQLVRDCADLGCPVMRYGVMDDMKEKSLENARLATIHLEDLLRRDSITLNMDAVRDFIKDKTVLVTGGAGSIGSELCRQALKFGAKKLIIFDFNENGLFDIDNEFKKSFPKADYETVLGSIRDRARLENVFHTYNPQVVFHAAAHKHVPMMELNPREAVKNNVFGTINTAYTAMKFHAEKFILISTDKAVNPTNIMGASKRIAELAIQRLEGKSNTSFAAVRFGNVLGSNGSVVPFFRKQIEEGGPVTVTHPDMRRYFMTIPEAVQLVMEAGAMASGGEIFVLDMGDPVRIYDLACDMIRLMGLQPERDIKIVYTGLRPGEKLFEELSLQEEDVTKTNNSKIYICAPVKEDFDNFAHQLGKLRDALIDQNNEELFQAVGEIVSTFHHKPLPDKTKDSPNKSKKQI
ncbi:MAG TPA: polysaccharide biosynthesis protein [Firmicutes bacterium]|nr:polysaccharide biosynthesis protein [Bacillota bacterium]